MRDPRNRDRVDRDERGDTAADIHKAPKRRQMRHARRYHIPCAEPADVSGTALLLLHTPREHRIGLAVRVMLNAQHRKADRLVDAGDQRDIARCPLTDAERALCPRDQPAHARQLNMQVVGAVTDADAGLQPLTGCNGLAERRLRADGCGILRRFQKAAFG